MSRLAIVADIKPWMMAELKRLHTLFDDFGVPRDEPEETKP